MAANVFEAEDFSNLTHWQSLAWHGAPRDHWRDTVPSVNDCSRTAPPRAPSGVAGMRRNQWLASVGITGWFASEYADTYYVPLIERLLTDDLGGKPMAMVGVGRQLHAVSLGCFQEHGQRWLRC